MDVRAVDMSAFKAVDDEILDVGLSLPLVLYAKKTTLGGNVIPTPQQCLLRLMCMWWRIHSSFSCECREIRRRFVHRVRLVGARVVPSAFMHAIS